MVETSFDKQHRIKNLFRECDRALRVNDFGRADSIVGQLKTMGADPGSVRAQEQRIEQRKRLVQEQRDFNISEQAQRWRDYIRAYIKSRDLASARKMLANGAAMGVSEEENIRLRKQLADEIARAELTDQEDYDPELEDDEDYDPELEDDEEYDPESENGSDDNPDNPNNRRQKRNGQSGDEAPNAKGGKPKTPGPNGAGNTAANAAEKQAGKAAAGMAEKQAASAATKQGLGLLLKNPYVLAAIAIIIIIIIIVIAIWAISIKNKAATGRTFHQATNPASKKEVLAKTLSLAGDNDVKKEITKEAYDSVRTNLSEIKASAQPGPNGETPTINLDVQTINDIDSTIALISDCESNSSSATCQEAFEKLKNVAAKIENFIPQIQGGYPIKKESILGYNDNLHYGSYLRTDRPNNDDGHGTYFFFGQNKGDAFDLITYSSIDVFPTIPGTVTNVSDDGTGNKKIIIKKDDYEILYANITTDLTVGTIISDITKPIGKTADIDGYSNLHIELLYCGKPLTTTILDKINKEWGEDLQWGQYLWTKYKNIFKLN